MTHMIINYIVDVGQHGKHIRKALLQETQSWQVTEAKPSKSYRWAQHGIPETKRRTGRSEKGAHRWYCTAET